MIELDLRLQMFGPHYFQNVLARNNQVRPDIYLMKAMMALIELEDVCFAEAA